MFLISIPITPDMGLIYDAMDLDIGQLRIWDLHNSLKETLLNILKSVVSLLDDTVYRSPCAER